MTRRAISPRLATSSDSIMSSPSDGLDAVELRRHPPVDAWRGEPEDGADAGARLGRVDDVVDAEARGGADRVHLRVEGLDHLRAPRGGIRCRLVLLAVGDVD